MTLPAETIAVSESPSREASGYRLFDPDAARIALTGLFRQHGETASEARPAVLRHLFGLLEEAHQIAERELVIARDGRACAAYLSDFEDALVHLIFDYVVTHVYRPLNPTEPDQMAIIATGGYGRGLLAPGSDIDLLFLLPSKQTSWNESVIEYILYTLWDLKQKVGHATRSIEQCLKLARGDVTIRTALLDSRLILGDTALFKSLVSRYRLELVRGSEREFVDAKLEERAKRHKRVGESRYKVEPNIKDGKGGLRDLHTLQWLMHYLHNEALGEPGSVSKVLTPAEQATFRYAEGFLWTVRCHLHLLTRRSEERLTFELQPLLAERLGYRDRGGMRGVERFMRHYFLVAKNVGELTAAVCAALEDQQLKTLPKLSNLLNPVGWRVRRRIRSKTSFRVDNGRLNLAEPNAFERDPVNLLRYFRTLEETNSFVHPEAARKLRASVRLIDDKVRNNREANRILLDLLTKSTKPENALRRMNEAGVLGAFVPEFSKVVSMMQYNMYHHYTVDEHLLRTIGEVSAIEAGGAGDELPLSTALIKTLQNRRVLFVAALLHDIAKGLDGDHSILGAEIARRLCPRFGLEANETDTVAWLIEEHLTMSNTAQSRDLSDSRTIRAFADVVQSIERLKLLLLLSVADIRAVGPGVWNGWKGQLLRNLYHETEIVLSGGHSQVSRNARVANAQDEFRRAVESRPGLDVERFVARAYPYYWLRTETSRQVSHANLLAVAEASGRWPMTEVKPDAFTAVTEFTVVAPNHPRLLAMFAGACAAAGANIVGAHIATTRDGVALDTFLLQRAFELDEDELRRGKRITETIRKLLAGESWPERILPPPPSNATALKQFAVPANVVIDNTLSDQFTVIEVSGLDRPGLLYELTSTLSNLNLEIASAHITTFGEKAVDVFYITDLTNKKVTSAARHKLIRDRLLEALEPTTDTGKAELEPSGERAG